MKREGTRLLIVTFVFYVSNLSWNTTDDTLRNVRQIFSGSAYVIMFLILSSPQIFFSYMLMLTGGLVSII